MNFEFPVWNPYWGAGHEAVIWSTVPIDPYTLIELLIKPPYAYFHLIHCFVLVMAGYYMFRKFRFDQWTAILSSLLFFMSPIVTYWYFEFINTNTFIAHMFTFLFMIKWFDSGRFRYLFLMGWSFFFGMFGTKLEFWFFESVFFVLLSIIAFIVIKPKKPVVLLLTWVCILLAILAHSWQINLLINALKSSKRLGIPHGFHNLFSTEMYRNLFLSLGDTDLAPAILIGGLFFLGLNSAKRHYQRFFLVGGLLAVLLFKAWNFEFLRIFVNSPVFWGALAASVLIIRTPSRKYILSTWILFILPAYYWCKPLVNFDELYLLRVAPVLFKAVWGFLVWLGCLQIHRHKLVQVAYLSILVVFMLQTQGQIILSYLSGLLWIPARDNYLIDFSFVVIAAFGTLTYFRFKPLIIKSLPFIIVFASYPNLYYAAPTEPVPGYANPLLSSRLPYDPFTGVPGLKKAIRKWSNLPYRRAIDPDIENKLPQNQGTFLLERAGNVTFYGSMIPSRYRNLVNFYRYGITPQDNIAGYPSTYSEKTIARLPRLNNKGMSNGLIYYSTVWIIPPLQLDLLRLLGVSHIITRDTGLLPPLVQKLKLNNILKPNEFNTAELTDTLPRSFIISNISDANLEDFHENMRPRIALEGGGTPAGEYAYLAKPARILKYEPEYIEISAESPVGGYLVLTDVFHPYWSASIDGIKAEILPAFHAFRSVKLPPGMHKIEFFCKVPYFSVTLIISLILILLYSAATYYFWDKKIFILTSNK